MCGDEPGGLAGLREQVRDLARVGGRRETGQTIGAHWRERQRLDGVDDAVEFERAQGAWLHEWRNL